KQPQQRQRTQNPHHARKKRSRAHMAPEGYRAEFPPLFGAERADLR
ncbi:hypothetical protein ABHI18_002730, partial [Aspergillus niger]